MDRSREPKGFGWGVVALLGVAIFINYVDRGNIATAAPLIKDQLRLDAEQVGILIAAFSWTYTPCQLLAGLLIERFGPYRTLALGVAVWGAATALTGLATGFVALIALRLALGLGESAAFPASATLMARNLSAHQLGRANAVTGMGNSLGPAFGTFAGGLLIAQVGWRWVFVVFGLVSLLWLWPWLARTRRLPAHHQSATPSQGPPWAEVIGQRAIWGSSLGHFSANYAVYFVLSWMPLYLVKARGFTLSQMAELLGVIYLVYACTTALGGVIADRWMVAGASANRARKTMAVVCHTLLAAGLLLCAAPDLRVSIGGLFLAGAGMGLNNPGIFAIAQTLAGPRAAPRWMSLQNMAGNVAGMVGPLITGWLIDRTGGFTGAFLLSAAVALAGVVGWGVVIPKVRALEWSDPLANTAATAA
ncbi:MAG TPA: MFS transporter [Caulobacteraceae bacterium]|jgi:MFS family permease|nr:MFS transporter [Caulobacteraceae bacterium]